MTSWETVFALAGLMFLGGIFKVLLLIVGELRYQSDILLGIEQPPSWVKRKVAI